MMSNRKLLSLRNTILAALIVLLAPMSAFAFGFAGAGGMLGYAHPEDLDGTTSGSVHAEFAETGSRVHLLPSIGFWSVNQVSDVSPNLDLYYHFQPEGRVSPYVGGGVGLNMMHRSRIDESNTDLGMNLMGGVRFPGTSHHVFLEGRYTASDVNQVSLLTGITFHTR